MPQLVDGTEFAIEFRNLSPSLDLVNPQMQVPAALPDIRHAAPELQQPFNIVKPDGSRCGVLHQITPSREETVRNALLKFDKEHGPGTAKRFFTAILSLKSRAAFVVDVKERSPANGRHAHTHVSIHKRRWCPRLTRLIFRSPNPGAAQLIEEAIVDLLPMEDEALVFDWATDKHYVVGLCITIGILSLVVGLVSGFRTHDAIKGLAAGLGVWSVTGVVWAILNKQIN